MVQLVVQSVTKYGLFYPDAGIMVLSATQVSASLPGTPAYKVLQNVVPATFQGNGLCPDSRVTVDGDGMLIN